MSSRSYAQFCGVAAAMDVLGERWAALVVRDLLDGPQRYTDLLKRLRGVSTDMLANRLAELETAGVVQRSELPPPAGSKVYELTELGRELEPVIHALARWGIRRLVAEGYDDSTFDPRWIELAVRACFSAEHAPRRETTIRFVLSEDADGFTVTVSRKGLQTIEDGSPADVYVSGTPLHLAETLVGAKALGQQLSRGKIAAKGTSDDLAAALGAFRLDQRG